MYAVSCGACKHGKCVDGVCVCRPGFFGDACDMGTGICNAVTQEGCLHGHCQDGQCVCKQGWFGDRCDQKGCPNQCSNSGLCLEPSEDTAQCLCLAGHFGLDCSNSGCAKGCRHGKCVLNRRGTSHCQCNPGWAGDDCGTRVCSPCVHGKCDGVRCVCEPGYTGIDCSRKQCPDCGDRGVCDPETGTCVCHKPWFNRAGGSPDCQGDERVCPRRCTSPGHGICLKTGCKCLPGWGGPACAEIRCPKDCNGQGECRLGKCYCHVGFTGTDCSQKTCPNQCSGRGICLKGKCHCLRPGVQQAISSMPNVPGNITQSIAQPDLAIPTGVVDTGIHSPRVADFFFKPLSLKYVDSGFGGSDCAERPCANDCGASQGRGSCDKTTGVCKCNKGSYWRRQGEDCSAALCSNKCSGHGLCIDDSCRCIPGYTGPNCETPVSTLDTQTQSMIEITAATEAASQTHQELTEKDQIVNAARNHLELLLAEADRAEAAKALAAMQEDMAAAQEVATETDEAIVNAYLQQFSSRSGAFIQVLSQAEVTAASSQTSASGIQVLAALAQGVALDSALDTTADSLVEAVTEIDSATAASNATSKRDKPSPSVIAQQRKLYDQEAAAVAARDRAFENQGLEPSNKCIAGCSGRGLCVGGQCLCNNSTGAFCQFLTCPDGCLGHGRCDDKTGKCVCLDGYSGANCGQRDCVPRDCGGQGTCVSDPKVDGGAPFCKCKPGFVGKGCQLALCPRKCSGNGLCVKGECYCNKGFSGKDCEDGPQCPYSCGAHGKCAADGRGDVFCKCVEGWGGVKCDVKLCGTKQLNCGLHGVCIGDKCVCETGYDGKQCERRTDCSPACGPNGDCQSDANDKPVCKCKPGFGGPTCQSVTCDKKCVNGGQCLDGKCACVNGWSGDLCKEGCPQNCNGRGTCVPDNTKNNSPKCVCRRPFFGPSCAQGRCPGPIFRIDGGQTFCSGHGTCNHSTGECACERGFQAPSCATFSMAECNAACDKDCKVGLPGAHNLNDPVTGELMMMLPAKCKEKCSAKCLESAPK